MTKEEDKIGLLRPEADAGATEEVPGVYRSLNFRSLQEPYHHTDSRASRYSTLRADNLETMLNGGLERFYKKYNHLSRKVNLQLPTPEVRFENLSFSVQVPESVSGHGTVGSHLASIFTPWQKVPMMTKHALHPMTGIIKPGSMTLILANPGAGKSTFLKALAGKLQDNSKTEIGGEILYSGLRGNEIDLIKLAGLVDQTDNHIPTLTVRETFKFADMCVNGRPEDQPEEMRDIAALRTELFLQILGLENCADTVVGDALLRGVSGGERKRVTVGEVLVGGQSLFLCDEISTGLDSAATFDIVKSMRTWCKTLGGSVIVALLQPTPEVVEMFDDILMINEGHMVYHGPRTEILDYFEKLGFSCPPRVDPADFLIEVSSGRGRRYANGSIELRNLPVTSEGFNSAFCRSNIYKKTHEAITKGFNEHQFDSPEDFTKAKSVANLLRSKQKSEFGLAFVPSTAGHWSGHGYDLLQRELDLLPAHDLLQHRAVPASGVAADHHLVPAAQGVLQAAPTQLLPHDLLCDRGECGADSGERRRFVRAGHVLLLHERPDAVVREVHRVLPGVAMLPARHQCVHDDAECAVAEYHGGSGAGFDLGEFLLAVLG
ncbi:hypothetical protein ON010_g957 [Phytophthora cinnamomi]|nr:hypothetical protein ON010_g957 [Phytophthora cinnamomi]